MTDIKKLANKIMREAEQDGKPVTEAEALEMAEMEIKAKGIKIYAHADKVKKEVKRETKLDADKTELIHRIKNALNLYTTEEGGISSLNILNPQREITFIYNDAEYSVALTKHRNQKKG